MLYTILGEYTNTSEFMDPPDIHSNTAIFEHIQKLNLFSSWKGQQGKVLNSLSYKNIHLWLIYIILQKQIV